LAYRRLEIQALVRNKLIAPELFFLHSVGRLVQREKALLIFHVAWKKWLRLAKFVVVAQQLISECWRLHFFASFANHRLLSSALIYILLKRARQAERENRLIARCAFSHWNQTHKTKSTFWKEESKLHFEQRWVTCGLAISERGGSRARIAKSIMRFVVSFKGMLMARAACTLLI
jgi:hypothetical protein